MQSKTTTTFVVIIQNAILIHHFENIKTSQNRHTDVAIG